MLHAQMGPKTLDWVFGLFIDCACFTACSLRFDDDQSQHLQNVNNVTYVSCSERYFCMKSNNIFQKISNDNIRYLHLGNTYV